VTILSSLTGLGVLIMMAIPALKRWAIVDGRLIALSNGFGEGDIAGLQIQRCLFSGPKNAGAAVIELAFPSRDDNRRETVADEVYAGAAHVH
jgi:hypothetical protein